MPALEVQKVAVVNCTIAVLSFKVTYGSKSTPSSTEFPTTQFQVIDLSTSNIEAGTTCFPTVSALIGITEQGDEIIYQPNGQTATYVAVGASLGFSVTHV